MKDILNVKSIFEECITIDGLDGMEFEETLHVTWQYDEIISGGSNLLFVNKIASLLYLHRNSEIGIGYHELEYILNDKRRSIGKRFTNEPTIPRVIEELIYALKRRDLTNQRRNRYKRLLSPFLNEEFARERFNRIYYKLTEDEIRELINEYLWDNDLM